MTQHFDMPNHSTLDVSSESISHASDALRSEAARLNDVLLNLSNDEFRPCGGDPASIAAATAFNDRYRVLVESYRAHIEELNRQANELTYAALDYSASEEHGRQAFKFA